MKSIQLAIAVLIAQLALPGLAAAPHSGIDRASIDPSVRIQDDLFQGANGSWLRNTAIPANKTYVIGVEVNDITDGRIRALVDSLAAAPRRAGTLEHKIGAFYASYLDTAAIDRAGFAPVQPLLAEIDAVGNLQDLAALQGRAQGIIETPVWLRVFPDLKDPSINTVMTWQGGLGLPDRDYYLVTGDARLDQARQAYAGYLVTLARLAGLAQPEQAAASVMALERRIAATHWKREDLADPGKMYNPTSVSALAASAPGYEWQAFFNGAAMAAPGSVTVTQPDMVKATAALYAELPLADWKLYFKLRLLDAYAPVLPQAFREARFAFRGKALGGAATAEPRWQQAIAALNGAMGEGVGRLYVERHFSPEHKARVQQMSANILAAYRESIASIGWMSPQTKAQALDKLARIGTKIGYPDQWRDYGPLAVRAGDAVGNKARAGRFNWSLQAAKVGHKVDRREWQFTPQTVDAMYDPMLNEIVFPAASLQPPFFDMTADDAANYGAIGANIGHEISHAFDTMGSQFDGHGVLRNWWTDADRKAYQELGDKLVRQFDAYEALPGKRVNGKLTLTENMADLSGMQVAFKAYQRSLNGKASPVIDGLSGEQRFFLAAAQFRRVKMRDEALLTMMNADPHAPHAYRANGPAVNTDGFHDAFATRPGDRMYRAPAERLRIW
jgi:putative endopeptidase